MEQEECFKLHVCLSVYGLYVESVCVCVCVGAAV